MRGRNSKGQFIQGHSLTKRIPRVLECCYCGKDFSPVNSKNKYCSHKCASLDKRLSSISCPWCGKLFRPHNYTTKYCSRRCSALAKWKPRYCKTCGTELVTTSGKRKKPKKFCSKKCFAVYKTRRSRWRRLSICMNCFRLFVRQNLYVPQKFCCRKCMGEFRNGPLSPMWMGGRKRDGKGVDFPRSTRKKILKRDNHKCITCSSTQNLHVDHIIPAALGGSNKVENGQTLCEKCHKVKTRKDLSLILKVKKRDTSKV